MIDEYLIALAQRFPKLYLETHFREAPASQLQNARFREYTRSGAWDQVSKPEAPMYERFTDRTHSALQAAKQAALRAASNEISADHILLGLLEDPSCFAVHVLEHQGIAREAVSLRVEASPASRCSPAEARRVVAAACDESQALGDRHVGTEHLLLGILRVSDCSAARILTQAGLTLADARRAIRELNSQASSRRTEVVGGLVTEVLGEVADKTGNHRLRLRYIEVPITGNPRSRAFSFHSLAWETKSRAAWTEVVTITEADFQRNHLRRRWIRDLHRLEPATGRATIQIGEEGSPDSAGAVRVTYSWREWNLRTNTEVRVLQVCASPFDPFRIPENEV